jgi:hypothetical protein
MAIEQRVGEQIIEEAASGPGPRTGCQLQRGHGRF